ncbi:MAG: four helix bundle protein [Bacteroidales bacterium]|jgi:four helix bundle protein|nr:four helix bundle protein [Bacteroidales bacterium]
MCENVNIELNEPEIIYNLEERTFQFAKNVRFFVETLPQKIANIEDSKQLIRASASVGANYIEANESLGKKDFLMRLKIARKEAKESAFFLRLINENNNHLKTGIELYDEAIQLNKILSAIINKSR